LDQPRRIAIVSAYPALRAGLRALLTGEGLSVVGEADSLDAFLGEGEVGAVEAVVVDPSAADVAALLETGADLGGLRPLVLGPIAQPDRLGVAMAGRAWGYVPRDANAGLLAGAARAIAGGLVAIEPTLAPSLAAAPLRTGEEDGSVDDLTGREREVLSLVAAGLANKQIAQRLKISEHTVKFHVAAILAKLGAQSRTEAGYLAARRGLIAL
jgi:two-component system, NarL family, nitrate/nitrite response regulator NarL